MQRVRHLESRRRVGALLLSIVVGKLPFSYANDVDTVLLDALHGVGGIEERLDWPAWVPATFKLMLVVRSG